MNKIFNLRCLYKACLNGEFGYVKDLVEKDNVEIYDHPGFMIAFQCNFLNIAEYLFDKGVNYEFVKSLARTNVSKSYNHEQMTLLLKKFKVNANLFPLSVIDKYFEKNDSDMINNFRNNFLDKEVDERLCIKYNLDFIIKQEQ